MNHKVLLETLWVFNRTLNTDWIFWMSRKFPLQRGSTLTRIINKTQLFYPQTFQ
jgi:hypothetical protein